MHDAEEEDVKWWNTTESWWTLWWEVVQKMNAQVEEFRRLPPHKHAPDGFRYFLDAVAPGVTAFLYSCFSTTLQNLLGESSMLMVQELAENLIQVANLCIHITRKQVCGGLGRVGAGGGQGPGPGAATRHGEASQGRPRADGDGRPAAPRPRAVPMGYVNAHGLHRCPQTMSMRHTNNE